MNDLKHRRREAASVKIASLARGRQARRRVSQLREEQVAATDTQKLDERGADERYMETTEGGKPHVADTRHGEAAIMIQRVARGRVGRLYVKTVRKEKLAAGAMQKTRPDSDEPIAAQEDAGGDTDVEDSTVIREETAPAVMTQGGPEEEVDSADESSHLSIDQRPVNLSKHEVGMKEETYLARVNTCCPCHQSSSRLSGLTRQHDSTSLRRSRRRILMLARPFQVFLCFMKAIWPRRFP